MPTLREIQRLVRLLEDEKGFGHDTKDKILWLGEEYGELVKAYKHNDLENMKEEATDILFFVASILSNLRADGDKEFLKKLSKNMKRQSVVNKEEQHFDRSDKNVKSR